MARVGKQLGGKLGLLRIGCRVRASYVVDKDLGSQVHMTFKENEPCFLVFNLRKGYSISALRIRSSWSNGPKRVSLSPAVYQWTVGALHDSRRRRHRRGQLHYGRWQGKVVQGYRNQNLKTTIQFRKGFKLNGRFLRLDIRRMVGSVRQNAGGDQGD